MNTTLSIVIATWNRREILLDNLNRLNEWSEGAAQIIVVDNASTDGTDQAVAGIPNVELIRTTRNYGSCAKAIGLDKATAEVILLLDDDAHPLQTTPEDIVRIFADRPRLGAAGFAIHGPGGIQESSALPHVFVGCGVALRSEAARAVGGLDTTFFMQAEEYDLSFRLLRAGYEVEIFPQLKAFHEKTPSARRSSRTWFFDVRNNLRVIDRYLPHPYRSIYRQDLLQRYGWMAGDQGYGAAFRKGAWHGWWQGRNERSRFQDFRLTPNLLEAIFCWNAVRDRMQRLHADGFNRIVLADLGKNLYTFYRGANEAGLRILAIADDALARPERFYRGLPLLPTRQALNLGADAFVVSNTSYAHATRRFLELSGKTSRPVYSWFDRDSLTTSPATPHGVLHETAGNAKELHFSESPSKMPADEWVTQTTDAGRGTGG